LEDPDGIGVELYADRPKTAWPVDNDGKLEMVTQRLDLEGLLAMAE
jgi:catechol 2,3-dioxygenase